MAFVSEGSITESGATLNVTLDVGTSANRKAVAFYWHQQNTAVVVGTVQRDPLGTPESMTLVNSFDILDPGEAYFMLDVFRLDLSVTGSQTFQFNTASGSPSRSAAYVVVWDGLAAGAEEAVEEVGVSSTDTVSDSLVTVTNDAVIMGGAFLNFISPNSQTAPFWAPNNGQTERYDAVSSGLLPVVYGDLVKATAGSQTFGWTGNASGRKGGSVLVAFAPSPPSPSPTPPRITLSFRPPA